MGVEATATPTTHRGETVLQEKNQRSIHNKTKKIDLTAVRYLLGEEPPPRQGGLQLESHHVASPEGP